MHLFFDTETTGTGLDADIVQLGAVLANDDARVQAELNVLIRPHGWTVPPAAQAIHGISTEQCEAGGVPIKVALELFGALLLRAKTLVAHNLEFDTRMLRQTMSRYSIRLAKPTEQAQYCTMLKSTDICKLTGPRGYKWPRLAEAYQVLFGETFEGAHDAMADVRACMRVYFELRKREQNPAPVQGALVDEAAILSNTKPGHAQ